MAIFIRKVSGLNIEPRWKPAADVFRTSDGSWVIKLELAGVQVQDVTVEIKGPTVQIHGIRRDTIVEEGWSHYSMEISYSSFERTFEFPCDLDNFVATNECRGGMLLIRLTCKGEKHE